MARISYADTSDPAIAPLAEQIRQERGGKMLNLYRMLLRNPEIADGWRALLTAVRQRCTLSGKYRELAILRVAVLNGADYEFAQHAPFALREGYCSEQIEALKTPDWRAAFDDRDCAVVDYVDAMTRQIRVPDQTFATVAAFLDEREIMELTTTVAAYNMVSRFLEALQIDHD